MQLIQRSPSKFHRNHRMHIVSSMETAEQLLRHPAMQIPNLLEFLQQVEQSRGFSLEMMRCFVNASPFFLENERHMLLRRLAMQFMTPKGLAVWQDFAMQQVQGIVDDIDDSAPFDLVQVVGFPMFNRIARPLLGIYPSDVETFDRIASTVQRLIEPMPSLRKLKTFEGDFKLLMQMLEATKAQPEPEHICGVKIPARSVLSQLLQDKPLDTPSCYAFVTAMYSALAPLVQTAVSMLATIYVGNNGKAISVAQFSADFETLLHAATAPKFIHRIAQKDVEINGEFFAKGTTALVDIQAAVVKNSHEDVTKHLSFGSGTHFCVGAPLSKLVLKKLVPVFMQRFPELQVLEQQVDEQNNIAFAFSQFLVSSK